MDPQLQALGVQLGEAAVRNTAGAIADRITAAKTRRKNEETIAELEEIVGGLLADKSALVRIAQAFEQELVAQRIAPSDIEYISNNLVPIAKQLVESGAADKGEDPAAMEEMIDLLQPILSVETVTVLQLIGFNFRKAIGEPLTALVARLISSRAETDPNLLLEIERLRLEREIAVFEIAKDADAYARLAALSGD